MLKIRLATEPRRVEAAVSRPRLNTGVGLEAAAALGVGYHVWLLAIREVSGPGAFELVGMDLWDLGWLYLAGMGVAGLSCDLLEGRSGLLGSLV